MRFIIFLEYAPASPGVKGVIDYMDFKKMGMLAFGLLLCSPLAFAAYSGSYDSSDIPNIVVDFLGTMGVQAVAFAGLIALLVILGYAATKAHQLGKF